jgi:hypothetical protein
MVVSLSQFKEIDDKGCGHNLIYHNIFLIYSASLSATVITINYDFIVE